MSELNDDMKQDRWWEVNGEDPFYDGPPDAQLWPPYAGLAAILHQHWSRGLSYQQLVERIADAVIDEDDEPTVST